LVAFLVTFFDDFAPADLPTFLVVFPAADDLTTFLLVVFFSAAALVVFLVAFLVTFLAAEVLEAFGAVFLAAGALPTFLADFLADFFADFLGSGFLSADFLVVLRAMPPPHGLTDQPTSHPEFFYGRNASKTGLPALNRSEKA